MSGYGQYCPVAQAAEVLGEKWTILIIRELCLGPQSFNSLRRGLPLISPTLLSNRLKSLSRKDIVTRVADQQHIAYGLTEAGEALRDIIMQLGHWGQRWVPSDFSEKDLDASLLMWDMHRAMPLDSFPPARSVIQFEFMGSPAEKRFYWLVVENKKVDVCIKNPGYDIDLFVVTQLQAFTAFWMGGATLGQLRKNKQLSTQGDQHLERSMHTWLCGNAFANPPA